MPKGYENKDKDKVYKPSGLMPKNYKSDHSSYSPSTIPTSRTTKTVNWKRILVIVIPMLLIFIVWMVVRASMIQQWEAEDTKMLQECYSTFGQNDPFCNMYK